jgi:hypothetical protein
MISDFKKQKNTTKNQTCLTQQLSIDEESILKFHQEGHQMRRWRLKTSNECDFVQSEKLFQDLSARISPAFEKRKLFSSYFTYPHIQEKIVNR